MPEYEKRFKNVSREEMAACIRELEDHVTVKGRRLLSTGEIQELLTLLPANYFKSLVQVRIQSIAKKREDFPEKLASFDEAARNLVAGCVEHLEAYDLSERELFIRDMDNLRLLHPALWFSVYKRLWRERLDLAIELEAHDKEKPFRRA